MLTRFSEMVGWPSEFTYNGAWSHRGDFFPKTPGQRHIVSVNPASGDVHEVAPGAYASWSPEGGRIAIIGMVGGDDGYLATVGPDGSDFRVLVNADEDGDLELADD